MKNLAILFALTLMISCSKIDDFETVNKEGPLNTSISIRSNEIGANMPLIRNQKFIVLGNKINNPYSVENLNVAFNSVYGISSTNVTPTDLYVSFFPQSYEELKALEERVVVITDYPQDYEILEEGQVLSDIADNEISIYYGYVPIDFQFLEDNYTILDELNFDVVDLLVLAESYKVSNNANKINEEVFGGGLTVSQMSIYEGEVISAFIPPKPEDECPEGFEWKFVIDDSTTGPNGQAIYIWLCMPVNNIENEVEEPLLNECGCPRPSQIRNPAGCVQVNDTQLGLQGVIDVQVAWGNGWGKWTFTTTDENGCFSIPNYIGTGKEIINIIFRNDRSVIRAIRPNFPLLQYSLAVRDIRSINGPNFNDVSIIYNPDNLSDVSMDKLLWYTAQTNNGIQEFHDYCNITNIPPPADDLDILMTPFETGAAAPMLDDLAPDILSGIFAFNTGAVVAACFGRLDLAIPAGVVSSYLAVYSPDIVMNYGGEMTSDAGGFMNSDLIKNTVYHELGHAQHFQTNGSSIYWGQNILYVVQNVISDNNAPYGNRNDAGSERCAIIETWGNHQGYNIAETTYGLNTSLAFGGPTQDWHRHIFQLERFRPDVAGGVNLGIPFIADDDNSWIPAGILHDCSDILPNPLGVNEIVIDNIGDFTQNQLMNSILGSPNNIQQIEDNLETMLPVNQNIGDLTTLFNEYGY